MYLDIFPFFPRALDQKWPLHVSIFRIDIILQNLRNARPMEVVWNNDQLCIFVFLYVTSIYSFLLLSQAASFDMLECLQSDIRAVPRMSDPLHECLP